MLIAVAEPSPVRGASCGRSAGGVEQAADRDSAGEVVVDLHGLAGFSHVDLDGPLLQVLQRGRVSPRPPYGSRRPDSPVMVLTVLLLTLALSSRRVAFWLLRAERNRGEERFGSE